MQALREDRASNYSPSLVPEEAPPLPEEDPPPFPLEDLSSDSLSMARVRLESDRGEKRQRKSYEFYQQQKERREAKQAERRERFLALEPSQQQQAVTTPVPQEEEFDPDIHDYHQSQGSKRLPAISENQEDEANETASKRLRATSASGSHDVEDDSRFCYLVVEEPGRWAMEAQRSYYMHEEFYAEHGVDYYDFAFAFKRNDFEAKYCEMYDFAMGATPGIAAAKKKGRKEILLKDLSAELREQFVGDGGDTNVNGTFGKRKML